jgi:hypothetical protein
MPARRKLAPASYGPVAVFSWFRERQHREDVTGAIVHLKMYLGRRVFLLRILKLREHLLDSVANGVPIWIRCLVRTVQVGLVVNLGLRLHGCARPTHV